MKMKSMKNIGLIVLVAMSLTSCANRYSNTSYKENVIDNKTIAILPYKVTTTGRIPKELTDEMLLEIEYAESEAFQASLYHQFLGRMQKKRFRHLDLKVQAYEETNQKLFEADVDLLQSTKLSAKELSEILGVDAVVRSNVHKTNYLTNLESYGIDLAADILYILTDRVAWFLPSNNTSDVRISTTIVDTSDGNALWSASRRCPTDWRNNTHDVIERINHNITRRLPR